MGGGGWELGGLENLKKTIDIALFPMLEKEKGVKKCRRDAHVLSRWAKEIRITREINCFLRRTTRATVNNDAAESPSWL